MEFTNKELVELLGIRQQNIDKALKETPYKLGKVEGSAKPVKHYSIEDLPQRYKDKLSEQGIEEKVESKKDTDISKAKFTTIYLMASPDKKEKAMLKCRLIEFYLKRKGTLNQKQWLKDTLNNDVDFDPLGKVSIKQLNDWLKLYNDAKKNRSNVVEAFIDKRGAKAGAGIKTLTEQMKKVAESYFIKDTFIKMTEVHRNMKFKFGDMLPSYDVLNNYYKEWKKEKPLLYAFAQSPDGAKNKYMPAVGNMSEKAKHKNHYWELDSTPADIICEDGKRYAIMAAIDVFTRRVVFHVSESSSSFSISQLLRKAILKFGIPENVVIDNGKDYTSNHFMSVCYNLGINPVIVPPFSGDKKPHVERIFGTLSREVFMQIPGFIGANVSQRSKIQARQSFAHKINSVERWRAELNSRSDEEKALIKDAWKIKKENLGLELNILKTAEELQDLCNRWVHNIYEQRSHGSLGVSPVNKWNNCPAPVETIPDESMLNLLLGESVTRRVGKKGVSFDGCNYWHEEFIDYLGKSVFILAPDDMGYIFVHDEKMKFICIAEDVEHKGLSRSAAKKAARKWTALTKHLDKMIKESKQYADVTIETRIEAAKEIAETYTYAVTKHTDVIDATMKNAPIIEAKDLKALEKSNKYDFKNKDKEGKPQKVLPSGRPPFKSKVERFVWVLEHEDKKNDKDIALMEKYPDLYELAKQQIKIS